MFRSALVSFNALRKGRFIRLDNTKYVALPARSLPKLNCSAERWVYNGQWVIEPVPVAEDNTHAKIDGRIFATYAVKFAISDIMAAAHLAAIIPSFFIFDRDAVLPVFWTGVVCYGYMAAVHDDHGEVAACQRSAISMAMGRDKYGYGPREF